MLANLEECNLMLVHCARRVCARRGNGEVVVEMASSNVGAGLGNDFCTLHSLTIPESCTILKNDDRFLVKQK
jgi:hypothetical protein